VCGRWRGVPDKRAKSSLARKVSIAALDHYKLACALLASKRTPLAAGDASGDDEARFANHLSDFVRDAP
jgi:hypothetical protein